MKIHSFLSTKCRVAPSNIEGTGVVAVKDIKQGEMIAVWGGKIYSSADLDEISKKYPHFTTHPFGVYEGFYMGPNSPTDELDDAEMFNHSCEANAGVKGQIILVARRDIKEGEEVCFDYETVEDSPVALGFDCKCKSKACRKKIDGSATQNSDYINKNKDYLSWYIKDKLKIN